MKKKKEEKPGEKEVEEQDDHVQEITYITWLQVCQVLILT